MGLTTGLALEATGLGRVSGSWLNESGALIPLVPFPTGEHLRYWKVPTGVLAVAAIAAAGACEAVIMPTARASRRRISTTAQSSDQPGKAHAAGGRLAWRESDDLGKKDRADATGRRRRRPPSRYRERLAAVVQALA